MRRGTSLALAGLLAFVGVTADAQTCLGRPRADVGKVQLIGLYASATGASQFGLAVMGIGEKGFAGAEISSISYDDISGSTTTLGGTAGYQLPMGTSGRAQLCPIGTVVLGSGPNDSEGTGVDASSRSVLVGINWGYRVGDSAEMAVIPTFGVGFGYASFELTDGIDSLTESGTFGWIGFGVGIVLGRQFTALPHVSLPLGVDNSDPVLGVSLSLSLGPRK